MNIHLVEYLSTYLEGHVHLSAEVSVDFVMGLGLA